MNWLWWTPFFNGKNGLMLFILACLVRFLFCQNLCLTTSQKHLDSFGQVFHNVEPIRTLNGLGSAFSRSRGIFPSSITTHHRQIWLVAHPLCRGFCQAVG